MVNKNAKPTNQAPAPAPQEQPQKVETNQNTDPQKTPVQNPDTAPVNPPTQPAPMRTDSQPPQQPVPQPQEEALTPEQQTAVETVQAIGGWDKEEVITALKAAFWNADRAVEYLFNGIPVEALQQQMGMMGNPHANMGQPQETPGQGMGGQGQEGDAGLEGIDEQMLQEIQQYISSPSFMELRVAAQQNPQILGQILEFLQTQNPRIYEFFKNRMSLFVQIMIGDIGQGGGQGGMPGQGVPGQQGQPNNQNVIRLSQTDADAIERLMGFGFEKYQCAEAYLACDKNEEWALNMLLDGQEQFMQDAHANIPAPQNPDNSNNQGGNNNPSGGQSQDKPPENPDNNQGSS